MLKTINKLVCVRYRYLLLACALFFQTAQGMERIHILIPGGAGGGWDTTARGVGDALARSGIVETSSFENISGGGGNKAISYLIETADRQKNTLLLHSTSVVLQALKGIFPQTHRDLIPIATVVADYGAFVVKADSKYKRWGDVIADYELDARNVKVAGGTARGSTDHLVAILAFKQSGVDSQSLRYIPYNAGANAMVGLLSEETQLLSTGLSEAIALAAQGEVRILAMTASSRVDSVPNIPTLIEEGVDVEFVNWRGFFAAPGIEIEKQTEFRQLLDEMYRTQEWEEIRKRRGWSNLQIVGDDFQTFLNEQEKILGDLMIEIGLIGK